MTSQTSPSSFLVRTLAVLFVVALSGLTLTGCLNDDNLIGENCYDEILNNEEELVDCGGPICEPCDPCENGEYDPLLGEQWVDCGGSCAPCDVHANGVLDEDAGEIGIDCGCEECPACPELCGDGLLNGLETQNNPNSIPDCGGPDCDPCPTCDDTIMNGDETGIDCGGSYCDPCECECDCTNGVQDGFEQFIDCGGPSCPDCAFEMSWTNLSNPFVDPTATVEIDPTNPLGTQMQLQGSVDISGVSYTITFIVLEPAEGWSNGMTISMNSSSIPNAGTYESPAGSYSTVVGGNMALNIVYIDLDATTGEPESGGIIAGNFSGNMGDLTGLGAATAISNGSFLLVIP